MSFENTTRGSLESRKDFKDTPSGQYEYWQTELKASERQLKTFRNMGTKIVKRYLGGSSQQRDTGQDTRTGNFRLNLFHSNVITLESMLYGNLPKVRVSRRYNDANDDVGRVASLIVERLLTNDIQDNGKEYNSVLRAVLQDRLLPGMGVARLRYEIETKTNEYGIEELVKEEVPADYYHWRDVAWGWARTFSGVPWIGFRSYLRKDAVAERFGEEAADLVQLKGEGVVADTTEEGQSDEEDSPWQKAEIWEIWDKERRQVVWLSPGYDKVLDTQPDPLGLSGFYPCPPFFLANQTTSLYVPTSDFTLAQDLYNEIDTLQTRISVITEAVKVVGVYDRSAEGIQRMFKEGTDNDLIPVDNWALFAEKGGIEGQIDWVPIGEISETLLRLRELRDEAIGLLQQVTGMSDIMRGQLGGQYEGVGQSELKAKFGSVRVQALQDEFANFASDLLQLKAEIIGLHFSPESIARYANVSSTWDMEYVPAAIQLIKQPDEAKLRVEVKPESLSMVDYAQLKQERTDYLTSMASYLSSVGPIIKEAPAAKPLFLEMMKWGLAGFKGSNDIEGVVDKAIAAAEKESPQSSDGEAEKEQAKSQGQMQLEQLKHQNAMEQLQAKAQADMALREHDAQFDNQKRQMEMQAEMAELQAAMQSTLAEIQAKMMADITVEKAQSGINAEQHSLAVQDEVVKEGAKAQFDMAKEQHKTELEITKIAASATAKIKEAKDIAKTKPKETGGGSDK